MRYQAQTFIKQVQADLLHEHIDDPSIGCMDSANLLRAPDTHVITFLKVGAFSICLHGSICLSHQVDGCACPCFPLPATSYEVPAPSPRWPLPMPTATRVDSTSLRLSNFVPPSRDRVPILPLLTSAWTCLGLTG
jgi:hypothetical protein